MKAATSTLSLYALVVVIAEVGLGMVVFRLDGAAQILGLGGMILILALVVGLAGWRYTSPRESSTAKSQSWEDKKPVLKELAESVVGTWGCQWTCLMPDGNLTPYVDDTIVFYDIDRKTGSMLGRGLSAWGLDANYEVVGRLSESGLMHLSFSTPPPKMRLSGMVVLRITPTGDLSGWWVGTGLCGEDIGGAIRCARLSEGEEPHHRVHSGRSGA